MRHRLSLLLAAALTVTVAPASLAGHVGHTYEFEDAIEVTRPGTYATHEAHDYEVLFVEEGTEIAATLTWEDDPTVDMDVFVLGPGDACDQTPPELACHVDLLAGLPGRADCGGSPQPGLPSGDNRQTTVVADEAGTWTVQAAAKLAAPTESIPYELTFTVDGSHADATGPEADSYTHTTGHCSLVG